LYCLEVIVSEKELPDINRWDKQLLIHIVRKSSPRFTNFPSLVLIKLVLTEIQPLKNVKINKEMYGNPDAVRTVTSWPYISL